MKMIRMSPKWDEWLLNDMNESRMSWMTAEWCEWLENDMDECGMMNKARMRWMS